LLWKYIEMKKNKPFPLPHSKMCNFMPQVKYNENTLFSMQACNSMEVPTLGAFTFLSSKILWCLWPAFAQINTRPGHGHRLDLFWLPKHKSRTTRETMTIKQFLPPKYRYKMKLFDSHWGTPSRSRRCLGRWGVSALPESWVACLCWCYALPDLAWQSEIPQTTFLTGSCWTSEDCCCCCWQKKSPGASCQRDLSERGLSLYAAHTCRLKITSQNYIPGKIASFLCINEQYWITYT
jgi:hypothetical protein